MKAGALSRQIILQTKGTPTRDSLGGEVITWTTFATVWAELETLGGAEFVTLKDAEEVVSTRYRIRYLAGVNPSMRVLDGSDVFEIVAVLPDRKRTEIVLVCRGDAPDV